VSLILSHIFDNTAILLQARYVQCWVAAV